MTDRPQVYVPGSILSLVFGSMNVEDFLAKHWQREPVVIGGRDADHFAPIFSLASFERLIEHVTIPSGNVDMGIDAVGADPAAYKPHGAADAAALLKMHSTGKTIILRAMHLFDGGLRQACAAFAALFRCNTQANVYITPAGTRSSYPHWDAHDLFILQVSGTKVWTLHDNDLALPHPDFRFDPNAHPIGEPTGEIEVRPGDTLYLPRGQAHNPYATSHSVHVSLGVQVVTWYDLLTTTLQQRCLDTTAVREALPLLADGLGLDGAAMRKELERVLEDAFERDEVRLLAESLLDGAARSQSTVETSGLFGRVVGGSGSIAADSIVELRTQLPSRSSARIAGATRVLLSGLEFDVAPREAEMADFVVAARRFRADDLPGDDRAVKLAFLNHLLGEGCVSVIDPDPTAPNTLVV